MEDERIRKIVAQRLAAYRKRANYTQAEIAEKLNYSDKSVSKWERGDGLPDLLVLCKLAEIYEIPVDEFLHEGTLKRPASVRHRRHWLISLLSMGLAFLVAAIVYYILTVVGVPHAWLCFIVALPVAAILAVVFSHIWSGTLLQCISVSALVWSLALTIYLFVRTFVDAAGNYLLFALAGGMQVLVLLWYLLQHYRKKSTEKGK